MSDFEPLDVISVSRDTDTWPALIVLLRDYRDPPGWICIHSKTAQIERVFDSIAYRYHKVGRAGSGHGTAVNGGISTVKLQKLLAEAVW